MMALSNLALGWTAMKTNHAIIPLTSLASHFYYRLCTTIYTTLCTTMYTTWCTQFLKMALFMQTIVRNIHTNACEHESEHESEPESEHESEPESEPESEDDKIKRAILVYIKMHQNNRNINSYFKLKNAVHRSLLINGGQNMSNVDKILDQFIAQIWYE
jgi:hypothetical protein